MSRTVSFACALTLLAGLSHVSVAEPPTTQKVLDAAREAAHEDGSRESLLQVAKYALKHDRQHALADYQAALAAPAAGQRGIDQWKGTDRGLIDGLLELGAEDEAREFLEPAIGAVTTIYGAHASGVYATSAQVAAEMAERLWPHGQDAIGRAAGEITRWLDLPARPGHAAHVLRPAWLRVLAFTDPQRAWGEAIDGAPETRPLDAQFGSNIARAWPARAASVLDLVIERTVRADDGRGQSGGLSELAAAVLRIEPERAIETVASVGPHELIWDYEPLARAVLDVGLDALPVGGVYDRFHADVSWALARLDPEVAVELTGRIESREHRAVAIGGIVRAIAESQPERARTLALEVIPLLEPEAPGNDLALLRCAWALIDAGGGEEIGEFLGRARDRSMVGPAWWRWRERHPEEAERWIAGISERDRCDLLVAVVGIVAQEGTPAQVREFAHRVVASPELRDSTFRRVMSHLAAVDPDRTREVWQARLSETPLTGTAARDHVEGLRIAAETFVRRGESAAPELAEIERTLERADEESWVREFRARLTHVYVLIDPEQVRDRAALVLAQLEEGNVEGLRAEDLAPAGEMLGALAAVDLPTVEALLREHPSIAEHSALPARMANALARHDPEAAVKLVREHTEERRWYSMMHGIRSVVIREGDPHSVRRFIEIWLDLQQERAAGRLPPTEPAWSSERPSPLAMARAGATAEAAGWLVHTNCPELPQIAFEFMREISGGAEVIEMLRSTSPVTLEAVPDELLEHLLREVGEGRGFQYSQAIRKIGGEMAARDWERGMEVLDVLEPRERVRALLSIRTQ